MARYDNIQEVRKGRTFEEILKFNPFHDSQGRFSSGNSAASFTIQTKDPSKQHWADMAIARQKDPGTTTKPANKIHARDISHDEALDMRKQMGQDKDSMTTGEYRAIMGYCGTPNSFSINKTLREENGYDKLSPKDKNTVDTIEAKAQPAPTDIKLVRNCSAKELLIPLGEKMDLSEKVSQKDLDKMVGKIIEKPDLTSTGFSNDGNCFKGRPVQLNLNCPEGKKILFRPDDSYSNKLGRYIVAESEVILPRNTAYKITRVRQEVDKWGDFTTIVDADILLD